MKPYKILFSIELLHDFYSSGLCKDFEWEPAPDCLRLLQNYKLLLKDTGHTLLVLAKTEGDKPVIPLADDIRWRFYLRLKTGNFYTYTNWNERITGNRKFWATNLSGNENNHNGQQDLLLTVPLAAYNNTAAYSRGQMVTAAGTIYESILVNEPDGGNNKPLNDAAFWINTGSGRQFATAQDVLSSTGSLFRVMLTAASTTVTTTFRRFDPATNNFTIKAKEDSIQHFGEQPVEQVSIDTAGLPPGRYQLTVNDIPYIVYIDPQLAGGNYWGVAEIHHHSALSSAFKVLDQNGVMRSPRYKVRFRNRSTLWKYILRSGNGDNRLIEDKDDPPAFVFEAPAGDMQAFISTRPIPVTEQPRTSFQLVKPLDNNNRKILLPVLPNPRLDVLREATRTTNGPKYFASEIYLNI